MPLLHKPLPPLRLADPCLHQGQDNPDLSDDRDLASLYPLGSSSARCSTKVTTDSGLQQPETVSQGQPTCHVATHPPHVLQTAPSSGPLHTAYTGIARCASHSAWTTCSLRHTAACPAPGGRRVAPAPAASRLPLYCQRRQPTVAHRWLRGLRRVPPPAPGSHAAAPSPPPAACWLPPPSRWPPSDRRLPATSIRPAGKPCSSPPAADCHPVLLSPQRATASHRQVLRPACQWTR